MTGLAPAPNLSNTKKCCCSKNRHSLSKPSRMFYQVLNVPVSVALPGWLVSDTATTAINCHFKIFLFLPNRQRT